MNAQTSSPGRADVCAECGGELLLVRRTRVTRFCSQRCRQRAHDFARQVRVASAAAQPMRFCYLDPPYVRRSRLYRKQPTYAGEVNHGELLDRVLAGRFDGWALSAAEDSLQLILRLCDDRALRPNIAAWSRGSRPGRSRGPRSSWEPVIYMGGREEVRKDWTDDSLNLVARPRRADPRHVIGAKPAAFCSWLFDLWGAAAGDALADWFPGSGGVGRAWVLRGGVLLNGGNE